MDYKSSIYLPHAANSYSMYSTVCTFRERKGKNNPVQKTLPGLNRQQRETRLCSPLELEQ